MTVLILIIWIGSVFVARSIGKSKRRDGWVYGLLLGPIGVLIVALLPPRPDLTLEELEHHRPHMSNERYERTRTALTSGLAYRECPFCKEDMRRDASVCPHCRRPSPAWTLHEGHWWTDVDGVWYRLDELTNSWVQNDDPLEPTYAEQPPRPGA